MDAHDVVEGKAQAITNNIVVDTLNLPATIFNALPRDEDAPGANIKAPLIPHVDNSAGAKDSEDFQRGIKSGNVLSVTGLVAGGGGLIRGAESLLDAGANFLSKTLKPTESAATIQKININLTDAKGADVGNINGSYNPATQNLHVDGISVDPAAQNQGNSVTLYKAAIKQAQGEVKSVSGYASQDNAEALADSNNNAAATPRAKALNKLGFTDHSYNENSNLMVSKKTDTPPSTGTSP